MNKQDKETLRLTLMAFENNSTNLSSVTEYGRLPTYIFTILS